VGGNKASRRSVLGHHSKTSLGQTDDEMSFKSKYNGGQHLLANQLINRYLLCNNQQASSSNEAVLKNNLLRQNQHHLEDIYASGFGEQSNLGESMQSNSSSLVRHSQSEIKSHHHNNHHHHQPMDFNYFGKGNYFSRQRGGGREAEKVAKRSKSTLGIASSYIFSIRFLLYLFSLCLKRRAQARTTCARSHSQSIYYTHEKL
jgi:hypothetical protein